MSSFSLAFSDDITLPDGTFCGTSCTNIHPGCNVNESTMLTIRMNLDTNYLSWGVEWIELDTSNLACAGGSFTGCPTSVVPAYARPVLESAVLVSGETILYDVIWSFPNINGDKKYFLRYSKNPQFACGFLNINDLIPAKHQCFSVNTSVCSDTFQAQNLAPFMNTRDNAGYNLETRTFADIDNHLSVFSSFSVGNLSNPNITFSGSSVINLPELTINGSNLTIDQSMLVVLNELYNNESSTINVTNDFSVDNILSHVDPTENLSILAHVNLQGGLIVYGHSLLNMIEQMINGNDIIGIHDALNIFGNLSFINSPGIGFGSLSLGGDAYSFWPSPNKIGLDNIAKNNGFESALSGRFWNSYNGATFSQSSFSHTGTYSAFIDTPFGDSGISYVTNADFIPVEGNTYYTISAWFYIENLPSGEIDLEVRCFDSGWGQFDTNSLIQAHFNGNQILGEWNKMYTSILVPADGMGCFPIILSRDGGGTFFVDSVQFEEGLQPTPYRPQTLNMFGDVGFKEATIREDLIVNGLATANVLDVRGPNVGVIGLKAVENIKADTFLGDLNIGGCDEKSNKVRQKSDGGLSFEFGDPGYVCPGTENCVNGEDDNGDGLIDYCDPECGCITGHQLSCTVCAECQGPTTGNVGQSVTFSPVKTEGWGSIPAVCDFYSDDGTDSNIICSSTTHTYNSEGTYSGMYFYMPDGTGGNYTTSCPDITIGTPAEICDNGIDDNGNGLTDYCDPACSCPSGEPISCTSCGECVELDVDIGHPYVNDLDFGSTNDHFLVRYNHLSGALPPAVGCSLERIGGVDIHSGGQGTDCDDIEFSFLSTDNANQPYMEYCDNVNGDGTCRQVSCGPYVISPGPEICTNSPIDDDNDGKVDICDEYDCPCYIDGGTRYPDSNSCEQCFVCTIQPDIGLDSSTNTIFLQQDDTYGVIISPRGGLITPIIDDCGFIDGDGNSIIMPGCDPFAQDSFSYPNIGVYSPYVETFEGTHLDTCPAIDVDCAPYTCLDYNNPVCGLFPNGCGGSDIICNNPGCLAGEECAFNLGTEAICAGSAGAGGTCTCNPETGPFGGPEPFSDLCTPPGQAHCIDWDGTSCNCGTDIGE